MLEMKTLWLLYSIVAIISVAILQAGDVCCTGINSKHEDLDRRITALYQTVDFMLQRPDQMNVDAVIGLTLTEAHVKKTLEHENLRFFDQRFTNILSEVVDLSQRARRRAMATVTTRTTDTAILYRVLTQPDIWMRPITWTFGLLGSRPLPSRYNTPENVLSYFDKGTPNETESDRCIAQLADGFGERVCQVSEQCGDMLLRDDEPRGYPLTHRLLYVQAAIALRCEERRDTPFRKLIPAYCAAILQDAVDMEDANFPAISRDLITEQVLLCGMEGYTEFANDHYAGLIMSWPNSAGCYSAFGFSDQNEQRRSKRETNAMDYGCDNHSTTLGAASLSLLIRNLVETSGS